MSYDVPGRADQLSPELVEKWNDTIRTAYERLQPEWGSRFFSLSPQSLTNPVTVAIKWFADPAEPAFCLGGEVGRQLSDWGVRGRHVLHNEYCEYRTIEKPDASGRMRPKRIQVTAELREYWVCIAKHDPVTVRAMAESALGFQPAWEDLYGVSDPKQLTEEQREIAFSTLVAGNGGDSKLKDAGVPDQPTGKLNTDSALFMTHPINGLDDLLYIVMFGAKPFARPTASGFEPVTKEQIFREYGFEHLACRHADPAAAMGAYGAVFNGQPVAFANPLGMYIQSFTKDIFLYQDSPVPESWVRFSRGEPGMYQRLEFGPADDEPAFLDDIIVAVGSSEQPLTGGFQLLQQLEVGPVVLIGAPTPVKEEEYQIVTASDAAIKCSEARVCDTIKTLKQEYDSSQQTVRVAPRTMGKRQA